MSIDVLKHRLELSENKLLTNSRIEYRFARPHKLLKTLDVIERKFEEMENAEPVEEKIIKSLFKLRKHGKDYLTRRDWKNLAWSMSKKLPGYDNKILFTTKGKELLGLFESMNIDLLSSVFYPLLYGYFSSEKEEINGIYSDNWVSLRQMLSERRSIVFHNTNRPKKWLKTLTDYPELLSTEPSKELIQKFLSDRDGSSVNNELESLRISSNSWFWDSLVSSSVKSIKSMKEDDFLLIIGRFFRLMEKHPIYINDILIALLERYAASSLSETVHERLKDISLDQWGNPQYESSAGWHKVTPSTKKMVVQWFVRADLEAFFKLFSHTADKNRFDYWMRFINKTSFSQIFLGPAAMNSYRSEHREFRKANKGRLKTLTGSTSTNNAFLLKINNIYIVEFSDTGNACYGYRELPYDVREKMISLDDLKNRKASVFLNDRGRGTGLSHSRNWKPKFDERLAALGVFPN